MIRDIVNKSIEKYRQSRINSDPSSVEIDKYLISIWQAIMEVPINGVINGQNIFYKKHYPMVSAIEYGTGGSNLIRAVQKMLFIEEDGILGPLTVRAIQKRLKVAESGYLDAETAAALQERLLKGRF